MLTVLTVGVVFQNCARPNSRNNFKTSDSESPSYIPDETPNIFAEDGGTTPLIDDGKPLYSSGQVAGTSQDEHARSLNRTSDGGYISTGVRRPNPSQNSGNDVFFQKWDQNGELVYAVNIGSSSSNDVGFRAMELFDSYLVIGTTNFLNSGEANRGNDILLLKLNKSNGSIAQVVRIGSEANDEKVTDVAVIDGLTANPQIWLVGEWKPKASQSTSQALVISVDLNLEIIWQRRFWRSGFSLGLNALTFATGHGVYAVGYARGSGSQNSFIMKFNKSGLLLNSRHLRNNDDFVDFFSAIESSGSDLVAVGQKSGDSQNAEGFLVRFDWNLNPTLAARVGTQGYNDSFTGVKLTYDGGLILSGTTWSTPRRSGEGENPDNWLTKLNSDYSVYFSKAYGTTSIDENGFQPLVVRPDNGYAFITSNFDSVIPASQGIHLNPHLLMIDQFGGLPATCNGVKGDVTGVVFNVDSPTLFEDVALTPTDSNLDWDDTIFPNSADFVDLTPDRNQFCTN